jgi:hypothetical protein
MNTGWIEIILGIAGIGLGVAGKLARSSMVIALGLIFMGVAHVVSEQWSRFLGDAGALLILLGLGMSVAVAIHQWRRK